MKGQLGPTNINRWNQIFIIVLMLVCGNISFDMTSAFTTMNFIQMISTFTFQKESHRCLANSQMMIRSRRRRPSSSNICTVLYDQPNQNQNEMIKPSSSSSQYVQQEQLLEVVARIGAETIASLSISERTKRAMLAEAVEDEIFAGTEQLIDLVNERQKTNNDVAIDDDDDENNPSELNSRNKNIGIEDQIRDLRERNQFLQGQYNDLVSGRSSSLLNTVNSVGAEDPMSVDGESNHMGNENDASYNQFS